MPPHTTMPPFAVARKAAGTRVPTGAKMMAASTGSGGGAASEAPAQTAPMSSANCCACVSPARVKAKARHPGPDALGHGHKGQLGPGELSVNTMEIRPPDAAGTDPQQNLIRPRQRRRHIGRAERLARGLENHGAH